MPDLIQFFIISDYMIIIIPLPETFPGRLQKLINSFGWYRFECPDQAAKWFNFIGSGGSRAAPTVIVNNI